MFKLLIKRWVGDVELKKKHTHIYFSVTGGIKLTAKYMSTRPQSVADAMTHALLSKYPKMRYLVGTDAHLFFRMLSLLPERAGDYILGWPKPYGKLCPDVQEGKLFMH